MSCMLCKVSRALFLHPELTPKTAAIVQVLLRMMCLNKREIASAFLARQEYHVSDIFGHGWLYGFTEQHGVKSYQLP